jgi:uncharacterized protein
MAKAAKLAIAKPSEVVTHNTKNVESVLAHNIAELCMSNRMLRSSVMQWLTDPRKDIDYECGFPAFIQPELYDWFYKREGIARKVVNLYPNHAWLLPPEVYEVEDPDVETPMESGWKAVNERHNILGQLHIVNALSRIRSYGVMLLMTDDTDRIDQPPTGCDIDALEEGRMPDKDVPVRKLLYTSVYPERLAKVARWVDNPRNPRHGMPEVYTLTTFDPNADTHYGQGQPQSTLDVHWSRVLHVCDDRQSSKVFGTPAMEPVFNYLCNIRKIVGGSGEMFWKGAFPGYSFETHPDIPDAEIDEDELREKFEKWGSGLQRILGMAGGQMKSLAPQVADPTAHFEIQMQAISITTGIPLRQLLGSEQGKLAATEDRRGWNGQLKQYQDNNITPYMLRPCVRQMICLGIVPRLGGKPKPIDTGDDDDPGTRDGADKPTTKKAGTKPPTPSLNEKRPAKKAASDVMVEWPDLNTVSDTERADIVLKKTQALAAYMNGGVNQMIPEPEYLTLYMGHTQREAQAIGAAATKKIAETEEHEDERTLEQGDIAAELAGKTAGAVAKAAPPVPGAKGKLPAKAPKKLAKK